MTDFWWGVLALPLIVLAIALTAAVVFGGWQLLESWAERRHGDMDYDPGDTAHLRVRYATWVMAAPICRRFRLGYGCTLIYTRGINRVSKDGFANVELAIGRSVAQIDPTLRDEGVT